MLDGVYLTLVFASNDEAANSLAAEITEISAANHSNSVISAANEFTASPSSIVKAKKKYNNTQYFAKFSLFFESFATKKLTRKQVKISNFIVM